jgi:hypothetical protein
MISGADATLRPYEAIGNGPPKNTSHDPVQLSMHYMKWTSAVSGYVLVIVE